MGLDAAYIVMEVEDHFGIMIRYSEAMRIRTVDDLVDLIARRIAAAQDERCAYLDAFLKLRRCVRDATFDRNFRIRPRQLIADRLTKSQTRRLWSGLRDSLELMPSGLRRPRLLRHILVFGVLILWAASLLIAIEVDFQIWPLTFFIAGFCTLLLHLATIRYRMIPPAGWESFGAVAAKLIGVDRATKRLELRSKDEIMGELRPLIVEVLGVHAHEVVLAARFVEDLGVG